MGRNDILDKMRKYFDSDVNGACQRIFVLYGLGGAGKSQLAFKFIEESKLEGKRYVNLRNKFKGPYHHLPTTLYMYSFSDIFYIDATSEETLQTDLETIAPGNAKQSVEVNLRWLANQIDRNWFLLFDNADNVELKLKKYFPSCSSGNIIITTRNRELRHYTGKDADAEVRGMDLKDAKKLLLVQARAEINVENNALAEIIVVVISFLPFHGELYTDV